MMANQLIELSSVGRGIDPDTLITYPRNADGSYDLDSPVHLSDIDTHEWHASLSPEDLETVNAIHAHDKFSQLLAVTFLYEKCPECGSKKVVPIVYGYPSTELARMSDRGEVYLGGCCMHTEGNPEWKCLECMNEIYPIESQNPL